MTGMTDDVAYALGRLMLVLDKAMQLAAEANDQESVEGFNELKKSIAGCPGIAPTLLRIFNETLEINGNLFGGAGPAVH